MTNCPENCPLCQEDNRQKYDDKREPDEEPNQDESLDYFDEDNYYIKPNITPKQ